MTIREELVKALAAAKKRQAKPRAQERQIGTGTNERGPPVQTNAPANAWPSDGDSND